MTSPHDSRELANSVRIPGIGFGTWQIPEGRDAYRAVSLALQAGYRHIDTACHYGNEASVGRAVHDSGIPRDEIFVTTKLPAEVKDARGALVSFEQSLTQLGLNYVDLYLIHAPWPWDQIGKDFTAGNRAAWTALESVYRAGRARSIGVSNFEVADLQGIMGGCEVIPMVNQIRFFVGNIQSETVAFCRAEGILVEGFSPLATGAILEDPRLRGVAARYGKSVSQICIRYVIQKDIVPLPKSAHAARMRENADVGFEISAEDMAYLDSLKDRVQLGQVQGVQSPAQPSCPPPSP
jgi:diketogulonate reductase-like aldo/keto reductase